MNLKNCFRCNYEVFEKIERKMEKILKEYNKFGNCHTLIFSNNFVLRYSGDGSYERIYSLILGSTHDFPKWSNNL